MGQRQPLLPAEDAAAENLAAQNPEALRMLAILQSSTAMYAGPLPHPELLEGYNRVIENGAVRVLEMAERQSLHRMELEKALVKEQLRQSRWGQYFGVLLAILCLGVSTLLALQGKETVASVFASTTIIGLVAVFVIGRRQQAKSAESKP
jgi:uncharacterized membrane protein